MCPHPTPRRAEPRIRTGLVPRHPHALPESRQFQKIATADLARAALGGQLIGVSAAGLRSPSIGHVTVNVVCIPIL
jgi:hypothetical protein